MKNNKIEFRILIENKNKDSLVIDESFAFAQFKHDYTGQKIFLDNSIVNIDTSLYGKDKQSTRKIQRQNYISLKKTYKLLLKIIKYINNKTPYKIDTLYISDTHRKNNNDYLLKCMLNLRFNTPISQHLEQQLDYACNYLDREIALNNICDFTNGKCRKYRTSTTEKASCCKAGCRYGVPCKIKNISCKLFLCDTAISLGYFFYTQYIPMLRRRFTPIDRRLSETSLFLPMKTVTRIIRSARITILTLTLLLIISIIIGFAI